MEGVLSKIKSIIRVLNAVAGVSLVCLMLLTVSDVILRTFRRPIVGTYELVGFFGALVIGFAIPLTSWHRGHIYVDFFYQKFSKPVQRAFNTATRCLVIGLFFLAGWNLIKVGYDYFKSGEVSPTLQLPFYPIAYGLGICCFVECVVLACDIVKIFGGEYE
jgi:TRAP-type C4-dicarboxylate transport system permease small subunit